LSILLNLCLTKWNLRYTKNNTEKISKIIGRILNQVKASSSVCLATLINSKKYTADKCQKKEVW